MFYSYNYGSVIAFYPEPENSKKIYRDFQNEESAAESGDFSKIDEVRPGEGYLAESAR